MSSGGEDFQCSPNMMPSSVSSTIMLNSNSSTNDMNGVSTGENSCGGLVVIKQEPNTLQDYKSISTNYSNSTTEGCNMLQKVPSLSDLSDPENSLGMFNVYCILNVITIIFIRFFFMLAVIFVYGVLPFEVLQIVLLSA